MEGIYVMQERERLEAELTEARRELEEAKASFEEVQKNAQKSIWGLVEERGTALARAERAEANNAALRKALDAATCAIKDLTAAKDRAEGELSRMCRESMAYKQERDEALARAERAEAERDEADRKAKWFEVEGTRLLAEIEGLKSATHLAGLRADARAKERDEALALAETLRGALERAHNAATNPPYNRQAVVDILAQALAQQRERMEKALRVLERIANEDFSNPIIGETSMGIARKALAEFDAERGEG